MGSPMMNLPTNFELNPTNGLSANARKPTKRDGSTDKRTDEHAGGKRPFIHVCPPTTPGAGTIKVGIDRHNE